MLFTAFIRSYAALTLYNDSLALPNNRNFGVLKITLASFLPWMRASMSNKRR